MLPLQKRLNLLLYHYRRNNWLFEPRRFYKTHDKITIDRPVFLVGNQGGGLTLVSRMLRRHQQIISITGDHTYWAGADEMQKVMLLRLPQKLRLGGRWTGGDPLHPKFSSPRSWSYASDDLVDAYRATDADYVPHDAEQFRRLIREALHRYGNGSSPLRFIDKSQVFSLKMTYVNALLKDADPHFLLVIRNPYAACYRAAMGKAGDMKRYASFLSLDERVEVCAQHWSNTVHYILEDKDKVPHFRAYRFEDILCDPEKNMRDVCDFLQLPYDERLIPHENDVIPFGSTRIDRWYPLRPDVNKSYLEQIPQKYIDIIEARCGEFAAYFDYDVPRKTFVL